MYSFHKKEHLKSKKLISLLFRESESIVIFPLRLSWINIDRKDSPFRYSAGFAVSRKNFPKATSRNRIKRIMREAYRLNKHKLDELVQVNDPGFAFMFLYIGRESSDFKSIDRVIKQIFRKFAGRVNKNAQSVYHDRTKT